MAAKRSSGNGRGGARPGAGRKPFPPSKKRRNLLVLKLTDAELRTIRRAAGTDPLATWVRENVLGLIKRRRRKA